MKYTLGNVDGETGRKKFALYTINIHAGTLQNCVNGWELT